MRRLASCKAKLLSYGATGLIVGPGSPSEAAALAKRLNVPYPVLADPDGKVAAKYGFRKVLFNVIQQSGTVLVDQEGVIRYVRRSTNPSGALDIDALFLALRNV